MYPQAVLFDFDGTLADSYAAIAASVNHVRASIGLSELAEAEVRRHVGSGLEHLMEATAPGLDVEQALQWSEAEPEVVESTESKVRLDTEMAQMAENAVRYQALLGAIERTLGTLRYAARDGREG